MRKEWTEGEIRYAIQLRFEGVKPKEISKRLGRTQCSVYCRLERCGITETKMNQYETLEDCFKQAKKNQWGKEIRKTKEPFIRKVNTFLGVVLILYVISQVFLIH